MNLNKFTPLQKDEFNIEEMYKEEEEIIMYNFEDFLKIPVNELYIKNKEKQKLTLDSNFKSKTIIDKDEPK